MGLDMYLSKKTYVKNWDFQKKSERHTVTIKKGGKVRTDIKPERVSYITESVGYWRKANHIHQWFVDKDTSLAEELLPTQSGFFFGGTEYDQWYVQGLDETINQIEPLLQEECQGEFYYQASW